MRKKMKRSAHPTHFVKIVEDGEIVGSLLLDGLNNKRWKGVVEFVPINPVEDQADAPAAPPVASDRK